MVITKFTAKRQNDFRNVSETQVGTDFQMRKVMPALVLKPLQRFILLMRFNGED